MARLLYSTTLLTRIGLIVTVSVLSNGHASMLLYSLLHLTGYDLSIDDLKQFRQLHSKTPGHPELGYTPVLKPLQVLRPRHCQRGWYGNSRKTLAATFNRSGFPVVDHYTYTFLGDGCLMEDLMRCVH